MSDWLKKARVLKETAGCFGAPLSSQQTTLISNVWIHRRLRFLEVNAWETRGEERDKGLVAKVFVEKAIADADRVIVQTEMDAEGKYGRLLAWVHLINADGNSSCLNKALIDEGHGR